MEIKKNGALRRLQSGTELPSGRITTIQVERRGAVAIGTSRGLYLMDDSKTAKPAQVDALRGESIASLLEDREGNLWVGTEGSGLHILRPRTFRAETAAAGEAVTAVTVGTDGIPWFGTKSEGVHAVVNGSLQTPIPSASLMSPVILSLAPGRDGDVWAGTPDGLNHLLGKNVRQFTSADGLPDDFVRSVLVDTKGVVWAGTRRGLARIQDGNVTALTTSDGLGSDSIGPLLAVPQTHGAIGDGLWVGTSVGLSHLQGERFESFSPRFPAANGIVTAIASGGQRGLWVGFHKNGLSLFDGQHFFPVQSHSLPDEIASIAVDRQHFVWLRGIRSVYRVAENELLACTKNEPCQPSVAVYNTIDGMPSDTMAAAGTPAMWLAGDGALWVATRNGIAVADTSQVEFNATPPPVVIERLRIDDQSVPLQAVAVQIEPGHNRYAFDFAALSFIAPSKNRYRYMLEGFDRDWVEAGATRTASYTNLPARTYVFRVQAANNDGVWNRQGASVELRVLPPFYRRWWFYLLALLITAGLVIAIYRLRVLNMERRFALVLNERNRVAREVHDTLAQDFVSVTLQLDLAATMLKAKQYDQTSSQLQATRKLVKEGLEDARQSIWSLRANVIADSLPARLTDLVRRYAASGFQPRLKMGGAYHRVAQVIEDEVFRIAQESLSNINRHAKATEAGIDLFYEQNALRLNVRDNGLGFSTEEAKSLQGHYGLRGMQERAAAIGGTFTIQSEPGQGTSLTLFVPLLEREGVHK